MQQIKEDNLYQRMLQKWTWGRSQNNSQIKAMILNRILRARGSLGRGPQLPLCRKCVTGGKSRSRETRQKVIAGVQAGKNNGLIKMKQQKWREEFGFKMYGDRTNKNWK